MTSSNDIDETMSSGPRRHHDDPEPSGAWFCRRAARAAGRSPTWRRCGGTSAGWCRARRTGTLVPVAAVWTRVRRPGRAGPARGPPSGRAVYTCELCGVTTTLPRGTRPRRSRRAAGAGRTTAAARASSTTRSPNTTRRDGRGVPATTTSRDQWLTC